MAVVHELLSTTSRSVAVSRKPMSSPSFRNPPSSARHPYPHLGAFYPSCRARLTQMGETFSGVPPPRRRKNR